MYKQEPIEKRFVLKKYNSPVLTFTVRRDSLNITSVEINDVHTEKELPIAFIAEPLTETSLYRWLEKRKIPSNRTFVNDFLSYFDLDLNDLIGILEVSKGLSLNDVYWVVDPAFQGRFEDFNLYENPFSEVIGQIAFTGFNSQKVSVFRSSPEFTTGGMLAKCWRNINGKVYLYKAGTKGYANAGNEPYSEYYAAQLARHLDIPYVQYDIKKWKGHICSVCPLFTNKNVSYIPMAELIPRDGQTGHVVKYLQSLGEERFMQKFADMLFFDSIIENTDRHLNNFGILYDNKTNLPIDFAPLFDHGSSLLYHALEQEVISKAKVGFSKNIRPVLYNSYIDDTLMFAEPRHHALLRKTLGFSFKKHPKYNVSERRFKALNIFVKNRARILLLNLKKKEQQLQKQEYICDDEKESFYSL